MRTSIILLFVFALLLSVNVSSQDVEQRLNEAKSAYSSGDLENARFALQEALNEINKAIGNEILDKLPSTIGGMDMVENSDNVTGTNMGFAGLYVNRDYKSEDRDANFQIISDSPLFGSISALLNMSIFMAADPNQKRIKVDGYKALMTRSENEDGTTASWEVQVPFGNSLMTFQCNAGIDEKEMEKMTNEIPVGEIIKIAE